MDEYVKCLNYLAVEVNMMFLGSFTLEGIVQLPDTDM